MSETLSIVSVPPVTTSMFWIDATRTVCFTAPPARVSALAVVFPVRETRLTLRDPPAVTPLPRASAGASSVTVPLAVEMAPEIDSVPAATSAMSPDVRMALPTTVMSPPALREIGPLEAATASTVRASCSSMATVYR